jgi:hypothetical protein
MVSISRSARRGAQGCVSMHVTIGQSNAGLILHARHGRLVGEHEKVNRLRALGVLRISVAATEQRRSREDNESDAPRPASQTQRAAFTPCHIRNA